MCSHNCSVPTVVFPPCTFLQKWCVWIPVRREVLRTGKCNRLARMWRGQFFVLLLHILCLEGVLICWSCSLLWDWRFLCQGMLKFCLYFLCYLITSVAKIRWHWWWLNGWVWSIDGMELTGDRGMGRQKYLEQNPFPLPLCPLQISHTTGLGSYLDLRGERLVESSWKWHCVAWVVGPIILDGIAMNMGTFVPDCMASHHRRP